MYQRALSLYFVFSKERKVRHKFYEFQLRQPGRLPLRRWEQRRRHGEDGHTDIWRPINVDQSWIWRYVENRLGEPIDQKYIPFWIKNLDTRSVLWKH